MTTVKLLKKFITPLTDAGLIHIEEEKIILSNLRHLVNKGNLKPIIQPKLISQQDVADLLGIGISTLKRMEASGELKLHRKKLGSKSIRYRNTDVYDYILSSQDED